MSRDDDKNPEGVSLGRLVAAERNAQAALGRAEAAENLAASHGKRVEALERQLLDLRNQLATIRSMQLSTLGSGPTSR